MDKRQIIRQNSNRLLLSEITREFVLLIMLLEWHNIYLIKKNALSNIGIKIRVKKLYTQRKTLWVSVADFFILKKHKWLLFF